MDMYKVKPTTGQMAGGLSTPGIPKKEDNGAGTGGNREIKPACVVIEKLN